MVSRAFFDSLEIMLSKGVNISDEECFLSLMLLPLPLAAIALLLLLLLAVFAAMVAFESRLLISPKPKDSKGAECPVLGFTVLISTRFDFEFDFELFKELTLAIWAASGIRLRSRPLLLSVRLYEWDGGIGNGLVLLEVESL